MKTIIKYKTYLKMLEQKKRWKSLCTFCPARTFLEEVTGKHIYGCYDETKKFFGITDEQMHEENLNYCPNVADTFLKIAKKCTDVHIVKI